MKELNMRRTGITKGYTLVVSVNLESPEKLEMDTVDRTIKSLIIDHGGMLFMAADIEWETYYIAGGFWDVKNLMAAFNEAVGLAQDNGWYGSVSRLAVPGPSPIDESWTSDPDLKDGLARSKLDLRKTSQTTRRYELMFNVTGRWDEEPVEHDGPWSENVRLFRRLVDEFGALEARFGPGQDGILIKFDNKDRWLAISERVKEILSEEGYRGIVSRYAHGYVSEYYRHVRDPDAEDWKSKKPESIIPEVDIE